MSPNLTNHNIQIEVGFLFDRKDNNGQRLSAGIDQVVLTFPSGYELPSEISSAHITLNDINVLSPVVNQANRTVTFVTPQNLHEDNPALIRFTVLSGIRNPSGTSTGNQFTIAAGGFTGSTPAFSINQSNTTISAASVAPNPSVEFFPAEYLVGFTAGAGGYLNSNEKVFIQFPSGTTVPTGSISGVTVNGTNAVAVGTGNRNVEVIMPSNIQNSGSVQIRFRLASGLRNASNGSRNLSIYTSSETTPVQSDSYNLSPVDELSFSAITLSSDTVNTNTRYEIDFFTGMPGNLEANTDRIELTFPENTLIPSTINPSFITIQNSEGFTDSPTQVSRSGNTLILTSPVNIGSNTNVRVTIRAAAGFRNPSSPGNFQMSARTSRSDNTPINELTPSNPYSVIASDSRVSPASVTLSNVNQGATSNYTMNFSTGKNGRLGTLNTISIEFPAGTGINSSSVSVNGQSATRSISGQVMTINVPSGVTINNNSSVSLVASGVQNPSTQGSKSVSIHTSAEPTPRFSNNYSIGGTSISISSINVSPQGANRGGAYDIYINTANTYRGNENEYIRIFFPEGTIIPESINAGDVTVNGGSGVSASQVVTNPDNRVVDIFLESNGNSAYSMWAVLFNANAGIRNPALPNSGNNDNSTLIPDAYRLTIITSKQPSPAISPVYNIQPNNGGNATFNSMTASPNLGSYVGAAYTLRFTPGNFGRLTGGTSGGSNFIWINFYNDTAILPATIDPSEVTINGVAASTVERISNTQVRVYIPEGLSLSPNEEAELRFSSSVGITNGTATNANVNKGFQFQFDHSYSPVGGTFTLSNQVNSSFDEITLSDDTKNASSGYTIRFTPGSDDDISVGQLLELNFPQNTFVPSSINKARIRLNGQDLTQNAVNIGNRTIQFESPVNVGVGDQATLLISSNSGILNPTSPGSSYEVLLTFPSNNVIASPAYSIVNGSSTLTIPNVALSNSSPNQGSNYTINFRTGEFGRLIAGSSTLTAEFPLGTNVGGVSSAEINGVSATFSTDTNQRRVTVTIPASLDLGNDTNISLVISGLVNPTIENSSYTLKMRSSVEAQFVTSNVYTITSASPLTINNFILNSPLVNQNLDFEVEFVLGTLLTGNAGRIHVQFLDDYGIPVNLGLTGVTLRTSDDDLIDLNESQINFNSSSISFNLDAAESMPGGIYTLHIEAAANIRNPREPGDSYQIRMWTSSQPVAVTVGTPIYQPSNITSITNLIAKYTTNEINQPTQWVWEFTTGTLGALKPSVGRIFLRYPETVTVPTSISRNDIRVNGAVADAVTIAGRELQITVPFSATIGSETDVTVTIDEVAGIQFNGASANVSGQSNSGQDQVMDAETLNDNSFTAYTSAENSEEFGGSAPLPITLESLSISSTATGAAELIWVTLTEIENSGFEIYRSNSTSSSEWKLLAFVPGNGNSTKRITYSYRDEKLEEAGSYLYKLVQIDYDGTETVYGELEFTSLAPQVFALKPNYPNPFNPTTNITYSVAEQTEVSLIVYDILGRRVQVLVNEQIQPGQYSVVFNAHQLASGVYFIRMVAAGNVLTQKMQLIK